MQVQNINSTNFQRFGIQSSKMSLKQSALCDKFIDAITYSDAYVKATDECVDILMLSGKNDSIDIKILDGYSDMFFRKPNSNTPVGINVSLKDKIFKASESVEKILNDILEGKIETPEFDIERVDKKTTDKVKLIPDCYDEYEEFANKINGSISTARKFDNKHHTERTNPSNVYEF